MSLCHFVTRCVTVCHCVVSFRLQKDGQTALHIAAAEGDDVMVKFFYSIHANPKHRRQLR